MNEYEVTLPIVGVACMTIQAESEDEAINKALDTVEIQHIETWEAKRIICKGNILSVECNEADAVCTWEDMEDA